MSAGDDVHAAGVCRPSRRRAPGPTTGRERARRVVAALRREDHRLVVATGVADGQLHEEAVELALGQRVGALVLDAGSASR